MEAGVKKLVFASMGSEVRAFEVIGGGDTNDVHGVHLKDGRRIFVKSNPQGVDAFLCEARGLNELAGAGAIKVPQVLHVDQNILIMSWIEPGEPVGDTFVQFGKSLAKLHRVKSDAWGLGEDNYLGLARQINTPAQPASQGSWARYFLQNRLLAQLRISLEKGLATPELRDGLAKMEQSLENLIPDDGEAPTLLHGDLWAENFIIDVDGEAVLIDPAIYYGHREADLAMTLLFGGFPEAFYEAYEKEYPLGKGWRERVEIYQLYHLMNHMNLFGGSYYDRCLAAIHQCLKRI